MIIVSVNEKEPKTQSSESLLTKINANNSSQLLSLFLLRPHADDHGRGSCEIEINSSGVRGSATALSIQNDTLRLFDLTKEEKNAIKLHFGGSTTLRSDRATGSISKVLQDSAGFIQTMGQDHQNHITMKLFPSCFKQANIRVTCTRKVRKTCAPNASAPQGDLQ